MAKEKKDALSKIRKNYPDFCEAVDGLSVQDLENRLLNYAKELEKTQVDWEESEAYEKLQQIKQLKSEIEGPYKDTLKAIRLKSKYLVSLIKEKGGLA